MHIYIYIYIYIYTAIVNNSLRFWPHCRNSWRFWAHCLSKTAITRVIPPTQKHQKWSTMIKHKQQYSKRVENTLKPGFHHIKYDEQYVLELFLTLLELPNDQNYCLLWVVDNFPKHKSLNLKKQNYPRTNSEHLVWSRTSATTCLCSYFPNNEND